MIDNQGKESGEHPYCRAVCNKIFTVKSNLRKNKFLLSRELPYFCNVCIGAFSLKYYLIKHQLFVMCTIRNSL